MFRRNAAPAHEKPAGHPGAGDGYGRRAFSFGRWLRLYGVDLITMAAMGGKNRKFFARSILTIVSIFSRWSRRLLGKASTKPIVPCLP